MDPKAYDLALSYSGLSPRALSQLLAYFGSPQAVWEAPPSHVPARFVNFRKNFAIENQWEQFLRSGMRLLTLSDSDYPERLRAISDPPALFHKGKFKPGKEKALAIVGSRQATPVGKLQAEKLAETLAQCGFTIVSGLALGIDTAAHLGALQGGGKTVAVLGSGLDNIYPSQNVNLSRRIEESGALLSEFPPGAVPRARNFPQRNRIISGLCLGVIVVEAREKSGALITAGFALEQGRDVFALAGRPEHENSKGTSALIEDGAKAVEGINDILEEFSDLPLPKPPQAAGSSFEERLLKMLQAEKNGRTIESMTRETQAPVHAVAGSLLFLETQGLVSRLPGNIYVRTGWEQDAKS